MKIFENCTLIWSNCLKMNMHTHSRIYKITRSHSELTESILRSKDPGRQFVVSLTKPIYCLIQGACRRRRPAPNVAQTGDGFNSFARCVADSRNEPHTGGGNVSP